MRTPGGRRLAAWARAPRAALEWLRADPWERDRIRREVRLAMRRPGARQAAGAGYPRASGTVATLGQRLVAVLVALALLATSAVVLVVLGAGRDDGTQQAAAVAAAVAVDNLAVATAASFDVAVTTLDAEARASAIGRWVVDSQVPEFVRAFDDNYRDEQRRVGTLRSVPRAYKITESSSDVAVVLVWKELVGTGDRPARAFAVSAYGVLRKGTAWQVFSYEGMVRDVQEGDPRLDGFRPLYQRAGGAAP